MFTIKFTTAYKKSYKLMKKKSPYRFIKYLIFYCTLLLKTTFYHKTVLVFYNNKTRSYDRVFSYIIAIAKICTILLYHCL